MIEDDPEFSLFLGEYLDKYNIKIENFKDPKIALNKNLFEYDLLILDLTLPNIDGLDVCKKISEEYDIPIIISSARGDVTDKVLGLQVGADYYLPKPYDPKEMYAVIQSLTRRIKRVKLTKVKQIFEYNEKEQSITFNNKILELTNGEYEVMLSLIKNKNQVITRDKIVENCFSINDSFSRSLDVIIGRLRTKLGDNSKKPKYIHSIRGIGYKLSQ